MKKLTSIILAIVLLFSAINIPFGAFASSNVLDEPIIITNDFSSPTVSNKAKSVKSSISLTSVADTSSVKKTYNGNTYYGDGKELYTQIRNKIDARTESFKIKYYSTSRLHAEFAIEIPGIRNKLLTVLENLVYKSLDDSISVTSTDGDYARWSLYQYGANSVAYDGNDSGGYYYTIELIYSYSISDSEEKSVDQAINTYVSSLKKKNLSDYDTIKEVHDYICNSTTYDYKAADNPTSSSYRYAYTAYGALIKGKCVCQGYAQAFYRICKELGYSVRLSYSDVHGWNLIMLDGKYYFVDCTWDDEAMDDNDMDNAYYYFLVDYDTLISQDSSINEHTISSSMADDEYYINTYANKYATESYDYDAEPLMSTSSVALSKYTFTYNGNALKPTVTVKDKYGNKLVNNTDYTLTYSSCTNPGKATVKIKGKGKYAGMSTQRLYVIVPSKMSDLSAQSGSHTSSSIILNWSRPTESVSGYSIQIYKNGAWSTIKTISSASTTSYKVTGLSPSTKYKFRIRAYKTVFKNKNYGSYSKEYVTCTLPKTTSISSLSTKSKSVTVNWKKVACTGYQIQYSTSSDMKNAKTVTVSSSSTVSKKISSLKKGKKYYFRIRSFKKNVSENSKKTYYYYSAWSGKKSITVK
jgi:hypothetical protein